MVKVIALLLVVALGTLGCGDGNSTGNEANSVTGPTQPNVTVNCLGDTTIVTNVDCGDRSTGHNTLHDGR